MSAQPILYQQTNTNVLWFWTLTRNAKDKGNENRVPDGENLARNENTSACKKHHQLHCEMALHTVSSPVDRKKFVAIQKPSVDIT